MRNHGETPAFRRIIEMIEAAEADWNLGNRGRAERDMRFAASALHGESMELGPNQKPEQTYKHSPRDSDWDHRAVNTPTNFFAPRR